MKKFAALLTVAFLTNAGLYATTETTETVVSETYHDIFDAFDAEEVDFAALKAEGHSAVRVKAELAQKAKDAGYEVIDSSRGDSDAVVVIL